MKVLVTGAGGWVGRYCVAALSSAGLDVVSLGRSARSVPGGTTHVVADLLDPRASAEALAGLKVERVLHLAGETGRGAATADLSDYWRGNVQATLNLFDALDPSCGGVLIVSSAAVYGNAPDPGKRTSEAACLQPASWYGVSKAAQERVAIIAGRSRGIPVGVIRLFNLIGPDGPPRTVAYDLAHRLVGQHRRGEPLEVQSPETVRDFVDVRDAAEAMTRLLSHLGSEGEAPMWNVCTGRGTGVQELAELIRQRIPGARALHFRPLSLSPGNVKFQVGDPAAIQRDAQWQPRIDLEESVRDLVAHVLDAAA